MTNFEYFNDAIRRRFDGRCKDCTPLSGCDVCTLGLLKKWYAWGMKEHHEPENKEYDKEFWDKVEVNRCIK